jgi:hypothetical protein
MLPSHRVKPIRHTLFIDWQALYVPNPKVHYPLYTIDWTWPDKFFEAVAGFKRSCFQFVIHCDAAYANAHETEALGFLQTWVSREFQRWAEVTPKFIHSLSEKPRPNHVLAQISWNPSFQSWWVGNSIRSIRLGDQLNVSTCLLLSPNWTRSDLELQNATIPTSISESLFHLADVLSETVVTGVTPC